MFLAFLFACGAPVPDEAARVAALVRQLENGSPGERVIAAELLGDLGPAAAPAAPVLARVALDAKFAESHGSNSYVIHDKPAELLFEACLSALMRIGPKAAPSLVRLLGHPEHYARQRAAFSLPHPPPAESVPDLIHALRDDDPGIVGLAAKALGELGAAAEAAVPALAGLFCRNLSAIVPRLSPDWHPRVAAVKALVRIGPKAAPAIRSEVLPVLVAEVEAASGGWDSLPLLGEAAAPAVPVIVKRLAKESNLGNRIMLAEVLPVLGPDGRKAFAALVNDRDAETRAVAIAAMSGFGLVPGLPPEVVAEFVPQLVAAVRKGEREHRMAAVMALSRLGEKAPAEAVEAVAEMLRDQAFLKAVAEEWNLGAANFVYSLAEFGPHGVRLLELAIKGGSTEVRKTVVAAVPLLGPRARRALPLLRRVATEDADAEVATAAAGMAAYYSLDAADLNPLFDRGLLRAAKPSAVGTLLNESRHELAPRPEPELAEPENIPALVERLRAAAAADYPTEVIDRVAKLGPAAADAVPVLIELIPKLDASCAKSVMNAVGVMGPAAKSAVPVVVNRLTGENEAWHVPAALALADIGPAAKDAVPALRKLLTEPDPALRLAAAYALSRVAGEKEQFRAAFDRAVRREIGRSYQWVFPAELFEHAAPHAPELIPIAVWWLEKGSPDGALVAGLAKYGPAAREALPALRKVVSGVGTTTDGSKEACRALAAIGPAAREAIPDLRRLMETAPNFDTVLAARDAIRALKAMK